PGAAVRPDINVLMQALASRHPELVTGPGPDVPGTTIAVTLNADGSVGRSEILHTAPGDPWGLGAPLADRITLPGAGSILLQKGTRIGDAAVLNTHVRIRYPAPMSRTETAVPVADRTP